jgi:hypothetical protein
MVERNRRGQLARELLLLLAASLDGTSKVANTAKSKEDAVVGADSMKKFERRG